MNFSKTKLFFPVCTMLKMYHICKIASADECHLKFTSTHDTTLGVVLFSAV